MSPDTVIEIGRRSLEIISLISAPLLLAALAAGLAIGLFQAATQIQDMTLSFIPKLALMVVVLGLSGSWMLRVLVDYTQALFAMIPTLVQ